MKKIFLSFVALILVGAGAQAGILIDPYFGYVVSGSDSNSKTITGSDMGIRLGWTTLGFGVGVDATVSGSYTYKNALGSTSSTPAHTGVFVSYQFPILVRGYATYFLNTKTSETVNSNTGNGTKIGVQYTGLPFIALGLEILTIRSLS
jgi:hypothetical protein